MSGWRFFIEAKNYPGTTGLELLMRVRPDEPLLCAERLASDGTWHRDEQLFKQVMLGSDSEYIEVDEQRFSAALSGRTVTDVSVGRPSDEEMAQLRSAEKRISDAWSRVPIPPGAADITFPTRATTQPGRLAEHRRRRPSP